MKHQWLAKLALMVAWPVLAALILLTCCFALICAWFVIPFSTIKAKPDRSGYTMTFRGANGGEQ